MPGKISTLGRSLSDATIQLHESIARAVGLNNTDHKHLYMIAENSPITAGEIATRSRLTTGAVTGLINRLEELQLVRRIADERDGRKVLVEANKKKIDQLLAPMSARLERKMATILSRYTVREQRLIAFYLQETVFALRELREDIDAQTT